MAWSPCSPRPAAASAADAAPELVEGVKLKRGDRVWFWYRGARVQTYVHRVKGDDFVAYVASQRVQMPLTRARRVISQPTADVGEG
jgi:hypothetical protein